LNLCDDLSQILHLMSVYLYYPQTLRRILVGKGSYAGALARTAVSEKQYIVGRFTFQKSFGVSHKLFFLDLISHKVRKPYISHFPYRYELGFSLVGPDR